MNRYPARRAILALLAILWTPGRAALQAQTPGLSPASDTLSLAALQSRAVASDPRARQAELLSTQSRLRQESLVAERLPSLAVEGQAQYQSDVAKLPVALPGGASPPTPPNDTYDARLAANQRLYDPTLGARRAVERAQLAESESRLRATLYPLRQQVNDAFFAALRAQTQVAELQTAITDLEAQLRVAAARVREGTALPSEENTIRAELLRRRQAVAEMAAARRASLAILAGLTDVSPDSSTTLSPPDLAAEVADARAGFAADSARTRPEYETFARSRDVLARQERARSAQDLPRVSAYGRVGYGRPGLNPLNDTFDSYWLAGVQLQWSPWTWGAGRRDREVLAVQREMLSADEAAFTRQLHRSVAQDLETIDRLEETLVTDDAIIALRERILEETRVRFAESAVTSAEFVNRQTDLLASRIARAMHRVELAQARARFLTTLGIEVR